MGMTRAVMMENAPNDEEQVNEGEGDSDAPLE